MCSFDGDHSAMPDSVAEWVESLTYPLQVVNITDKEVLPSGALFNLRKVNDLRWINKFHEHVNTLLNIGEMYVSCVETNEARRDSFSNKMGKTLWAGIVFTYDFIWHRVCSKLPLTKRVYFNVTKGRNRPISRAEALGRLISCGFQIEEEFESGGLLYIACTKAGSPRFDPSPSYAPVFKMVRVGYRGERISVYKLRTMHPYSEYLQEYIIAQNKLHSKGKVDNDYRVTHWGRVLRRFWLDELPMIYNFCRGDLALVGPRPLSEDFFSRYPKDIQKLRIQVKPGLVPPYYADLPNSFEEVLSSEERFVREKLRRPLLTTLKYLFRAIVNIVFKGARSS